MLVLKQVSYKYTNYKGIEDINLSLEDGQIYALLGANGSGKTTLLKCILGLLDCGSDDILWNDEKVKEQYDRVAYISADGSTISYLKVSEYADFLITYYTSFDKKEYVRLLKEFHVEDNIISNLSKGEKVKVELAAGLAMQAKLFIFDEPFTGLDIYTKDKVIKQIVAKLKEDVIMIISTHDVEEIETIADQCIVLEEGKLVDKFRLDDLHENGYELKEYLSKYHP